MKKIMAAALVLLLALASVFAAGGKETESDGPVTIKVANYALLEKGYEEFWTNVKTEFEKQNPDVKLEWVTAPYGEIMNQVINMAGGGDKVDAVFSEISWIPGFEDSGLICPVTDILPKAFVDDFYPAVLDSHKVNGEIYGIPLYISPFVLYYNKNLFKEAGLDPEVPPTTYDEMLEYAKKLSQLKDANGNKVYAFGQTTASVPISGSAITAMIYNFGGDILDSDGNLSVDNDGFREAIEMLKTLDDLGYNPQNAKLKDLRNLFALGQLAMYYDQSWGFNGVKSINPDAASFAATAAPLKGGNGKGESLLQSHCFVLVNNGGKRAEAVSRFVQFVISKDQLNDYLTNLTPAYPAKNDMADMKAVTESGILKGAAKGASNVKTLTTIPTINDLNLELCTLAQAVTVSDKSVDEAISSFKKTAAAKIK
jgi:ABC-type sugar transport system, periplasmic component